MNLILYWHEYNPWKDEVVYVPIEELAECDYGLGKRYTDVDGISSFIMTKKRLIQLWTQSGPNVDAYILPCASGWHCMGIRYGKEPSEYISALADKEKLQRLLDKYRR